MYRRTDAGLLPYDTRHPTAATRKEGIMNDITFAASRLAVHRADELARIVERRRNIAERAAECVAPPVREHPRVRFPHVRLPHLHLPHFAVPHFRFPRSGGRGTPRPAL